MVLNPLNTHILSTYYVAGSVLGTGNATENKAHPLTDETYVLVGNIGGKEEQKDNFW